VARMRPGRRLLLRVAAGASLLVVLSIVGRVWQRNLEPTQPPPSAPAPAPVPTGRPPAAVVATIPVPAPAGQVLVTAGAVWVLGFQTVTRIDPQTNRVVAAIPLPQHGSDGPLVAGAGALWLRQGRSIVRIDPQRNRLVGTVPAGPRGGGLLADLAVGGGAVWLPSYDAGFWRFDLRTRQWTPVPAPTAGSVAAGSGAVWAGCCEGGTAGGGRLLRLDPTTGRVTARIPLPGIAGKVAIGAGGVWVLQGYGGDVVWRVDPVASRVVATIALPPGSNDNDRASITIDHGGVWVRSPGRRDASGQQAGGLALRIDPSVNQVVAKIPADGGGVAVGQDAIWTTKAGALLRTDPATNRLAAKVQLDNVELADLAVGQGAVWVAATGVVFRINPDRVGA
jgi:hypothetical protein